MADQDKAKEPPLGADALRFWAASASYTKEVNISVGILQASAEGLRKIRNTVRFILGNLSAADSESKLSDLANLSAVGEAALICWRRLIVQVFQLDSYVLHELAILSQTAEDAYERFEFNRAVTALTNFCTATLSSLYFEAVKDSLYNNHMRDERRMAVAYVLSKVSQPDI